MRGNKTDTLASEEPSVRKRPSQSSEGDTRVIGPVSAETVIKGKWSFRGAELMERRLLVGRRDDRLGGNNYSIRFGLFLINMFLMSLVIKSSFLIDRWSRLNKQQQISSPFYLRKNIWYFNQEVNIEEMKRNRKTIIWILVMKSSRCLTKIK